MPIEGLTRYEAMAWAVTVGVWGDSKLSPPASPATTDAEIGSLRSVFK